MRLIVDANVDLLRSVGEPFTTTDNTGYYSALYKDTGLVQVNADFEAGHLCVDSVTGSPLLGFLQSSVHASMTSPLTTIAMRLVAQGKSLNAASDAVCAGAIPCVPCTLSSRQTFNPSTNCLDVCTKDFAPLSVFYFDPLEELLLGGSPDSAWVGWLLANVLTDYSINCGAEMLLCASQEICQARCSIKCPHVLNYTRLEVSRALYSTLAAMTLTGTVDLTAADGQSLLQLYNETKFALGAPAPSDAYHVHSLTLTAAAAQILL